MFQLLGRKAWEAMALVCPEERSPRVQASFLSADEVGDGLKTTCHLAVGSPSPLCFSYNVSVIRSS